MILGVQCPALPGIEPPEGLDNAVKLRIIRTEQHRITAKTEESNLAKANRDAWAQIETRALWKPDEVPS